MSSFLRKRLWPCVMCLHMRLSSPLWFCGHASFSISHAMPPLLNPGLCCWTFQFLIQLLYSLKLQHHREEMQCCICVADIHTSQFIFRVNTSRVNENIVCWLLMLRRQHFVVAWRQCDTGHIQYLQYMYCMGYRVIYYFHPPLSKQILLCQYIKPISFISKK